MCINKLLLTNNIIKVHIRELSREIMSRATPNFCDQGGIAKSADLSQRAECTDGQTVSPLLCWSLLYKGSTFQLSSGELEPSSAHDSWIHSHSFCMPLLGSLLEYETDACLPAGCCRVFEIHYLHLNFAFIEDCIWSKQTKQYHTTDLCGENTGAELC